MEATDYALTYVGKQLTLIDGGYQQVTVEILCHLSGNEDRVQLGCTLSSPETGEPIAIIVWTEPVELNEPDELAAIVVALIRTAHKKLQPF